MRSLFAAVLLALTGGGAVLAQPLSCPTVATGRPCEIFHYHVQMYRPDTRAFVELYGINQFASQPTCERARDAQFKRNMAVIELYRSRGDQQYQPDHIGPCHCDMTVERASANYLTDAQRVAQIKTAEEIRQRVRERLLDTGVPSDSDVVRALVPQPAPNALIGGPKLVPMPQRAAPAEITRPAAELKMTKTAEANASSVAELDLPLVDIPSVAAGFSPPSPAPPSTAPSEDSGLKPAAAPPATPQPPAPQPAVQQPIPTAEVAADEPLDGAADVFLSYETQRIQNVLQASSAITDEAVKSKVLEACMQRIQLLANLRSLIQGSGSRSRLAAAARNAKGEPQRLALVAKLFGSDVPPHWAPKDASEAIVDTHEVETDPERILRDSGGKFTDAQKRHALYALLARTQPTEEQQLWLTTVIDGFLQ